MGEAVRPVIPIQPRVVVVRVGLGGRHFVVGGEWGGAVGRPQGRTTVPMPEPRLGVAGKRSESEEDQTEMGRGIRPANLGKAGDEMGSRPRIFFK